MRRFEFSWPAALVVVAASGKIAVLAYSLMHSDRQRREVACKGSALMRFLVGPDATAASLFGELVMLAFSVFALFMGLSQFHVLGEHAERVMNGNTLRYTVLIAAGLATSVFYAYQLLRARRPGPAGAAKAKRDMAFLLLVGLPMLLAPAAMALHGRFAGIRKHNMTIAVLALTACMLLAGLLTGALHVAAPARLCEGPADAEVRK